MGRRSLKGGSLSLAGLSGLLYYLFIFFKVISFVLNETVSFVDAPQLLSAVTCLFVRGSRSRDVKECVGAGKEVWMNAAKAQKGRREFGENKKLSRSSAGAAFSLCFAPVQEFFFFSQK